MKATNLILGLLMIASMPAFAQNVAINSDGAAPDNSAMLEVTSTTRGLLIPRMTDVERGAITSPAPGLMVYQTNGNKGFYYFRGATATDWQYLSPKPLLDYLPPFDGQTGSSFNIAITDVSNVHSFLDMKGRNLSGVPITVNVTLPAAGAYQKGGVISFSMVNYSNLSGVQINLTSPASTLNGVNINNGSTDAGVVLNPLGPSSVFSIMSDGVSKWFRII